MYSGITISQRIAELPRELQLEIVSHIDEISINIIQHVVFRRPINLVGKLESPVVYCSGIRFYQWVRQQKQGTLNYYKAARYGDPAIVKSLVYSCLRGRIPGYEICAGLAEGGHFELLKWAHFPDFPDTSRIGCPLDDRSCAGAAQGGHLDILVWLREQECPWDEMTCNYAAEGGHLELLKWARFPDASGDPGCDWNETTCAYAALGGHLEVLQWLQFSGCPWDAVTCSMAAQGGHLDVLKWARENGCDWDEMTCSAAAQGGHLDVLKWARENGCPWNALTYKYALYGGSKVQEWIKLNGCLQ
jgi:hypothetical protein